MDNARHWRCGLVLGLVSMIVPALANSESLTVCLDNYPPAEMHQRDGDPRRGFVADTLEALYRSAGYSLEFLEVNYNRGLSLTAEGRCDIMSSVDHGDEAALAHPREPMYRAIGAYWVHADRRDWHFEGLHSLDGLRFGVIGEYEYDADPAYDAYIHDPANAIVWLHGEDTGARGLQMVAGGALDVFSENAIVGHFLIAELGLSSQLRTVYPPLGQLMEADDLVLAPGFAPVSPRRDRLIEIWDADFPAFRRSAQFRQILDRYGVDPASIR